MPLYLVRDVMDKELLDCDGFKAGKVDDLVLELRDGEAPWVRGILTQHGALACYLPRPFATGASWLRKRVLGFGSERQPCEIPWQSVTRIDVTVHIADNRVQAGLIESEKALWERWISRLPFADR